MADEKTYLRAVLKAARQTMAPSRVSALSREVQDRLLASGLPDAYPTLVLYAAAGNEVATDALLAFALRSGKVVLFPRLDVDRGEMELGRFRESVGLVRGAFGIAEPPSQADDVRPENLGPALVVTPGVAFSARGERLGRGGGHYDRLLSRLDSQAITVGLAYSFQLLESLPQSGTDRRLNFVITESAVYSASDAPQPGGSIWDQGGTTR